MKIILISILFIPILSCKQPQDSNNNKELQIKKELKIKNNKENILNNIAKVHLNQLDNKIFEHYEIKMEFDSLIAPYIDILEYWTSSKSDKLTSYEKSLLEKLITVNNKNISLSENLIQSTLADKTTTEDIYELHFSKIAVDSTFAISVVGTYFKNKNSKYMSGGWEEIVIYEKKSDNWIIRKKIMILEY